MTLTFVEDKMRMPVCVRERETKMRWYVSSSICVEGSPERPRWSMLAMINMHCALNWTRDDKRIKK